MSLPVGWRVATLRQAAQHPEIQASRGALVPVQLTDRFRFRCVMVGDCCQHPDRGCQHLHRVGGVYWERVHGTWRCPFLQADNRCGTYETRPIPCRMFPLGLAVDGERRLVVVYKHVPPQRCLPCYAGRTAWSVASWIAANGVWPEIHKVCQRLDEVQNLAQGHV